MTTASMGPAASPFPISFTHFQEGNMFFTQLNRLFGKGQDRGFTLIELLIVILIVGILAAVAAPIYLGYVKDAKTAEAKAVVGSIWTALQSNAIGSCGTAATVANAYPKAGLSTTGATTPARWQAAGNANTLTVNCTTGAYSTSADPLITLDGTPTDVSFVRVGLFYSATATPPAALRCNTNATAVAATDPIC